MKPARVPKVAVVVVTGVEEKVKVVAKVGTVVAAAEAVAVVVAAAEAAGGVADDLNRRGCRAVGSLKKDRRKANREGKRIQRCLESPARSAQLHLSWDA
jgi:hypothetical protein